MKKASKQASEQARKQASKLERTMYEQTDYLSNLQDFVPYRGRCSKRRVRVKKEEKQGFLKKSGKSIVLKAKKSEIFLMKYRIFSKRIVIF